MASYPTSWGRRTPPRRSSCPTTTRDRSSRPWSAGPRPGVPTGRCCTSTASPTTSSRRRTPSGGSSGATTSTRSTCASTAARSARTRPRTTSPTCTTTSPSSTPPGTRIGAGHSHVVLSGHSTGGLTVPLWARRRARVEARGIVLNAPWFDLQGSTLRAARARRPVVTQLARRQPKRVDPAHGHRASTPAACTATTRASGTSTWPGSRSSRGRRTPAGWPPIRRGQPSCTRGLDLPFPALVLASARPARPDRDGRRRPHHDIVLDVEQIRRWAPRSAGT